MDVIDRVKEKIAEIELELPEGVTVLPIYDRSELILRAIDNLKTALIEVISIIALVVLLFLWHGPSAIVSMITIPIGVLIPFIPFRQMGITADIMSLGGIAIAMGITISGSDVSIIEDIGSKIEALLPAVKGARSAFAERTGKKEGHNVFQRHRFRCDETDCSPPDWRYHHLYLIGTPRLPSKLRDLEMER